MKPGVRRYVLPRLLVLIALVVFLATVLLRGGIRPRYVETVPVAPSSATTAIVPLQTPP